MTNGQDDGDPAPASRLLPGIAGRVLRRAGRGQRPPAAPGDGARLSRRERRRSRKPRSKVKVVLSSLAVAVALVLVGGALTAYVTFRSDWNSIKRVDVSKDLQKPGTHRPPADPNALNILLIGSDSRAGANVKFGAEVQGQRSDTVMVLHIAPGAHQVDVLSFPRDSMVPILGCAAEDGAPGQTASPGDLEQINATFAFGGPGCLWETVEQTTGIHINDFIQLTFTGFEHVIDDIGGVSVCLPVAVDDPDSKLHLTAGMHHVWGAEALAFWRARYIGEGSDLQRIQRDQFLMASLLQGIQHSGITSNPAKILSVIQDVTSHGFVTTDTQLTESRMFTIADELRGLAPGAVQFVEIPTIPYPGDPTAWVQWEQPQAGNLFAAIAHDTTLPKAQKAKQPSQPDTPVLDSLTPAQVSVTVLNGSTTGGLATSTSAQLAAIGYHVVGPPQDAASDTYTKSVIEYASSADLPAARTLAESINDATLQEDSSLTPGTVDLILGSSFTSVTAPTPAATTPASSGSQDLASQYGGIAGNVGICSDSAAFAGPDGSS
jgi:LCP family protein required for cell wall assembly